MKYYKQVVIDSSEAVIIQDFNGIVKAWNKSAEKIYGFMAKEMIGKNITKIISKKDRLNAVKNIGIREIKISKDNSLEAKAKSDNLTMASEVEFFFLIPTIGF